MPHSVIVPYRYPDPIEYRDIPGYPGYTVSNTGIVLSYRSPSGEITKTARAMKLRVGSKGHLDVQIKDEHGKFSPRRVHRLVLFAFVGPCPPGLECCHGPDFNPKNNNLCNLRWDTKQANEHDKIANGTTNRGERCGSAKLTEADVLAIREEYASGMATQRVLSERFMIHDVQISQITRGESWAHAGGPTMQRKFVHDVAVEVLLETGNPAVMWGDNVLVHMIAERAGIKSDGPDTMAVILGYLSKNPGRLIPGHTKLRNGRRVRIFRLPDLY